MKTIGERIKQARIAKGWSAFELAKKVGYKTQSGIGNLENKATGTGGNKIGSIARVLSVSVDWLLSGPDCDNVPFLPPQISHTEIEKTPTSAQEADSVNLYAVKNESQWPFELFGSSDWLSLSKKERDEFENTIAGAILRAKKTPKYAASAPHSI